MDNWQQIQSMQLAESARQANATRNRAYLRLLLIFLVAIWIVEVVIVWKSPEAVDRIAEAINTTMENPVASAPEVAVAQPPAKKTVSPRRSKAPVVAVVEEETSTPPVIIETPSPEKPAPVDRLQADVKADSAVVYLSNSADSPVMHVLSRGATVETRLQVIDSKGKWSLIRDPRGTGFVRSETLEDRKSEKP